MHSSLTARATALALAVAVTAGLLGSVDVLATGAPAPTVMATAAVPHG